MAEFRLTAQVSVSAYTKVEAETLEQAIEISKTRMVTLGYPGAMDDVSEEWVIDDADGEPEEIKQQ